MLNEFLAPSGIIYQRRAWTGGDTPRDRPLLTLCPDYIALAKWYLSEQLEEWASFWGDFPDSDTFTIFLNRALGDAWRTFTMGLGLTFPVAGVVFQDTNSCTQGFCDTHLVHPYHVTITRFGYRYSHSTPVTHFGGDRYIHHTYKRGTHNVGTVDGPSFKHWNTSTGTGSGHQWSGMGLPELEAHLASKRRRYGLRG